MNDVQLEQALEALKADDPNVQVSALRAMRLLRDARLPAAVLPLFNHTEPVIRRLAADILGNNAAHTDERAALRPLLALLNDSEAIVRASSADALGKLGSRSAFNALSEALYDEAPGVRFSAAASLGRLGDPRAVVELIAVLDSADTPLALMAAQALYRIGTPEALAAIQHLQSANGDYVFSATSFDDTIRRRMIED